MAIDSKAKRASVQAYTLGLMRPPPDGTVGDSDRPVVAWLYAGVTAGIIFFNIAQEMSFNMAKNIAFEITDIRRPSP